MKYWRAADILEDLVLILLRIFADALEPEVTVIAPLDEAPHHTIRVFQAGDTALVRTLYLENLLSIKHDA
jgi:hypothetical protein